MKRARHRLIALFAILLTAAVIGGALPLSRDQKSEIRNQQLASPPSPADLPNSCSIIATEAVSRLAATGAWTRIIRFQFHNPKTGAVWAHSLVVWQAPTTDEVCIYDARGTIELHTRSHRAADLARAFAAETQLRDEITDAHFW